MKLDKFFDEKTVIDLSFFNFSNAVTAAYFANRNLEVLRVNKNFKKFFPILKTVNNIPFTSILEQLGVGDEYIKNFKQNLEKNGFIISSSLNGNDGLKELKKFQPDLLLLDWMLPDLSGIEICKNIRKDNSFKNLPVIMLTAKGEEEDKIKGLDSGVDDYLTKPFSFNELMARIKAVLRRSNPNTVSDNLKFDDLMLDRIEKRVFRDGQEIKLGPTEFRLLEFFLTNPKRVYSRDQILESVWPNNVNVESRTIDVHIRRLRQSVNLKNKRELIRTVRSSGYSLI